MSAPKGGSGAALLSVVALAGSGTMVVELAAVRVLAPWFGTSSAVWTNVIGVVLLALALGYLLGSRLAARPAPLRALAWALSLAALATAALPVLAPLVAELFLPAGVTLDRAASLFLWGSLAAAALLFTPAALALGCVGPLAVELEAARGAEHAGTAGGRVLCASTLGSLAGTFGTTHYALPLLGVRVTFLVAAGVLALLAVSCWVWSGRARGAALLALIGLALPFTPRAPATRGTLLEAAESPYQTVRVVELPEGEGVRRQLQVNEGTDSFQSVWQPEPGLLPPGYYYDSFVLPAWWSAPRERWRVLVLGLGAGTAWRVLEGALPAGTALDATGVEIDPVVVALARRWMDLAPDGDGRRVLADWDARAALRVLDGDYDEVVLDAYANQVEIPAHLSSVEFFREVRAALAPGGWLAINVGGFDLDDPVVRAVASTAATAFEAPALVVLVPFSRNATVYLRRDARPPLPGSEAWRLPPGPVAELLGPLELEGRWALVSPGAAGVLTDDANAIERLQRASLRRAAAAREERLP
ncbi:MAG: fused MFS/spermidine synthase [Planctomycetes bacterium]|nr:fused MFS/spermidine synthase [Planctomycetota bacterium]